MTKRIYFIFLLSIFSTTIQSYGNDKIIILSGNLIFQDTLGKLNEEESRALMKKNYNNSRVEISIENDIPELFFNEMAITPDILRNWKFIAEINSPFKANKPVQVFINGWVGKYFRPEGPQRIKFNQLTKKFYTTNLILRSPQNAAAYKFGKCVETIRNIDNNINSDKLSASINCLIEATNYYDKSVIKLQLADLYSRSGNYIKCKECFDLVANKAKNNNHNDLKEQSFNNAAECLEKSILVADDELQEWDVLSEYIRKCFESGISEKSRIRQQLIRKWFDAFQKKLSTKSDLNEIISKVMQDDGLKNEWIDLFYYYFWSEKEIEPTTITESDLKFQFEKLAKQFNRSYTNRSVFKGE